MAGAGRAKGNPGVAPAGQWAMRERDLRALEFDKVRSLVRALAVSEPGRRLIGELKPATDAAEVGRRLRSAAEMVELRAHAGTLPIAEFADISAELAVAAREGAMLDGAALLRVRDFTLGARHLGAFLRSRMERFANLAALARDLVAPKELADALLGALADDGGLLDDASAELKRLRNRRRDERLELESRLARQLNSAGMEPFVADYVVTVRNRRFVLPLKLNYAERLEGIVQDRSVSGETLFVEPMWAVELNNRLMMLEREIEAEERRVYQRLTAMVGGYGRELALTLKAMVALDALNAGALFAERFRCVEPAVAAEGLELRAARHPLLAASGRAVVPIDVVIGPGRRGLVISGPNTGGKTVALKTIGLLALMAQAGLLIPAAEGSRIGIFGAIFADIGDEQSIEADLSSFSGHIANLTDIIAHLREPALVILDEPAAGTDPAEGAALTIGLLQYFTGRRCLVAVATHATAVKLYAYSRPELEAAAVDFDPARLAPLFRLKPHTIGQSYGLEVARRLGLPEEIIAAAEAAGPAGSGELESALERLEAERAELAGRIERQRERERELADHAERIGAQAERLRQRAQREGARMRSEVEQLIGDLRRQGQEILQGLRERARTRRDLAAFAAEAETRLDRILPPAPAAAGQSQAPLKVGDQVELGDIRAELLSLEPGRAIIGRGGLRIEVAPGRLRRLAQAAAPPRPPTVSVTAEPSPAAEVNLLGMRAPAALRLLEEFLDQAYLTNKPEVRVIHGIGSGALRKAVHEYLSASPYCAGFHEAEPRLGGAGVTIVELSS